MTQCRGDFIRYGAGTGRALCSAVCSLALLLASHWGAAPVLAAGEQAGAPPGEYRLDRTHASVVFRVSHLGFSFYTGAFTRFDAKLFFDPEDFAASRLSATVELNSLEIPAPPAGFRDELLGPKWFDAGNHPLMTYTSTRVEQTGPDTARVTGELNFRGQTHPVILELHFNGGYPGLPGFDPQARVGFSASGMLNRSDFGMTTGLPPEGSTMGVGDAVEFSIEAEFSGPPLQ